MTGDGLSMRALSIRAPWAWAIFNAGKDVENRLWTMRPAAGPMLVHASLGCTRAAHADAARGILAASSLVVPPLHKLPRGGLVGIATVAEVVSGHPSPWAIPGHHHLVLVDAVPLPFMPWKGQQQFFNVDPERLGEHATAYVQAWEAALAAVRRAA